MDSVHAGGPQSLFAVLSLHYVTQSHGSIELQDAGEALAHITITSKQASKAA